MYFSKSHEWIELKEKIGKVGITQYAQNELGEIVHVELPKIGLMVKAGQELCVLESTKAAADVYSPVAGKIIAVNEALKTSPEIINQQPESSGWLVQIEVSDPKELSQLMSHHQYQKLISS